MYIYIEIEMRKTSYPEDQYKYEFNYTFWHEFCNIFIIWSNKKQTDILNQTLNLSRYLVLIKQ